MAPGPPERKPACPSPCAHLFHLGGYLGASMDRWLDRRLDTHTRQVLVNPGLEDRIVRNEDGGKDLDPLKQELREALARVGSVPGRADVQAVSWRGAGGSAQE